MRQAPTIYVLTVTYPSGDSRKRTYIKSIGARNAAEKMLNKGYGISLEILSTIPSKKEIHPAVNDWATSFNVPVSMGGNYA
jgi:hypothetical protein